MKFIALFISLFVLTQVNAGTGHFHPTQIVKCKSDCTQEEASAVATKSLEHLVTKGKIQKSWLTIPLEKVEMKQFKKGPEWVLTFVDKNQPTNKQRLFLFITMKGWLSGSNFTGE
ncbi:MAG: DUF6488 family protein [Bacteriovoracaceae bacterium]|nr:DUF6488 family protein [Bacteriovoracaceae bacterium]